MSTPQFKPQTALLWLTGGGFAVDFQRGNASLRLHCDS